MTSPVLTERRWSGAYLVSEDNAERSKDQVTLKQQGGGTVLDAGTVLGQYGPSTGAPVYAATGGNTGNFTSSAVTEGAGAVAGAYKIEFIAATVFNLIDPTGLLVTEGKTGVAVTGVLGFTLTAGGTPAVAGDSATITVAANADVGKYAPLNLSATDGTQNAAAILFNSPFDVTAADSKQTVTKRSSQVNGSELTYPSGATANQIAAINAQLVVLGIIVR